jgi:Mg-chelatase subunit ChlD
MAQIVLKPKIGFAAKIAAQQNNSTLTVQPPPAAKQLTFIPPDSPEITNTLAIVFDDSASMRYRAIDIAKEGTIEFLRSCQPNTTAVGIFPLNSEAIKTDTNLPAIASEVLKIKAVGSTPLVDTIMRALSEKKLTRIIAFSDGVPDSSFIDNVVTQCRERKIPVDTCFIGSESDTRAISFMRSLAEETGGIFMHLKQGADMRSAFKYLAPAYRAMLMSGDLKDKIEKGLI